MNPFLSRPNRLTVRTFALAGLATLLVSCAKKPEAVNVRDLNQQFISAWNSKDADKVIGFLAEDVHFLQGNLHLSGKSSVAQDWVRSTLPTIADLKTNVVSSAADTETAYEGGTYSVDVLPETPDEPHGLGEGNFLLLWKKTADGSWKLSYAQLEGLPVQARGR